jgi:hypothetical protein
MKAYMRRAINSEAPAADAHIRVYNKEALSVLGDVSALERGPTDTKETQILNSWLVRAQV